MELSRSEDMYFMLQEFYHAVWITEGQQAYVDWHARYYGQKPWTNRYYAASSTYGVLPSQQGVEGGHSGDKSLVAGSLQLQPLEACNRYFLLLYLECSKHHCDFTCLFFFSCCAQHASANLCRCYPSQR